MKNVKEARKEARKQGRKEENEGRKEGRKENFEILGVEGVPCSDLGRKEF